MADFDAFVATATDLGLEVALDLALQCSPDHPWVTEHPEWFRHRADGTIAYAENPPKKYQDIYPLYFDADPDGILFAAVVEIVEQWLDHGVRIFRVDNPHTKPVVFWERLFAHVRVARARRGVPGRGVHPAGDDAPAREGRLPAVVHVLHLADGEVGARAVPRRAVHRDRAVHAAQLLREHPGHPACVAAVRRPAGVQDQRAVLASMLSPSWGVYAGYELFEHVAVRPGSEEYLDSEKYQLRPRDWAAAEAEGRSLAPYLTRLNQIRREHPALHQLRNLRLHRTESEEVMAFSKRTVRDVDGIAVDDTVIVVVNLDPHGARETVVDLDLPALGMDADETFSVHDLLTGASWLWGARNYVRLDPFVEPAHVLVVRRSSP